MHKTWLFFITAFLLNGEGYAKKLPKEFPVYCLNKSKDITFKKDANCSPQSLHPFCYKELPGNQVYVSVKYREKTLLGEFLWQTRTTLTNVKVKGTLKASPTDSSISGNEMICSYRMSGLKGILQQINISSTVPFKTTNLQCYPFDGYQGVQDCKKVK